MSNQLSGPVADVAAQAGHPPDHPARKGFFTDTSVCIGCKACEVACKEWNLVPPAPERSGEAGDAAGVADGLLGTSYDNSGDLGANTWRHVAFVEQTRTRPVDLGMPSTAPPGGQTAAQPDRDLQWLMMSDVCKHCTHAACLDVCPTGSLFRTEFGTVVVQEDICNGCGYCVPACPYGVLDIRPGDGRAWKCTLCYDRLRGGQEPACAKACPTDSIQFGDWDELRERAQDRVERLREAGVSQAQLYGADPADGVGGDGAFFLLLDDPEVYGLPPDPVVTTRDLPSMWRHAGAAGLVAAATAVAAFLAGRR